MSWTSEPLKSWADREDETELRAANEPYCISLPARKVQRIVPRKTMEPPNPNRPPEPSIS